MKPLFSQRKSLVTRLFVLLLVALVLLFVDQHSRYVAMARQWFAVIASPVVYLASVPGEVVDTASEVVVTRKQLMDDNARLKARNLILEQKVHVLATLTKQNVKLKELLNSAELVDDQVSIAEVIGVDPDVFRKRLTINKGSSDGAFEGQAILDAEGVMGQLIEVSSYTSRAVLLTDITARIPVQNARTEYRTIAAGTGRGDRLELLHVPAIEDFKVGDTLTSSGLGGSYPEGYPVGVVTDITQKPGDAYATIGVKPVAHTNRSRAVLLVQRNIIDLSEEPQTESDPVAAPTTTIIPSQTEGS